MEDHVLGQREQVFGNDVVAAMDQGPGARAFHQRDAGARAGSQLDAGVVARARDDLDHVVGECVADVDVVDRLHGADELFGGGDRPPLQHVELGAGDGPSVLAPDSERGVAPQDLLLLSLLGITEAMAEHEPVELRLGQLEGAALLDRVLGGDHQERGRQLECLVADRDAPLLHGFEHGALDLGGRAVDLVGQEQVGEDWPLVHAEIIGPLVQDLRPDDIRREQIDRELDAGETEVDRFGQDRDQERLRQARNALKQQVAAGKQRHQEPLDNDVLTDHHGPDALAHRTDELEGLMSDQAGVVLESGCWCGDVHAVLPAKGTRRPARFCSVNTGTRLGRPALVTPS